MKKLSRRDFITRTALGAGSLAFASQFSFPEAEKKTMKPKKMLIGFQTWTIRESLVKDFPGTLKKMAEMGYQSLEMCSPPGYQFAGFAPLMKYSAKEMKQIISDAGLVCTSAHYTFPELKNNLDERVTFALELGQKQMILSSFGLPAKATLDDWLKAADDLNLAGMKAKLGGIQLGFHNHHGEFAKIDDKLIYDELMNRFDPDSVKMQFQVAVFNIGYKAVDYFKKYPGRFISAHLADYASDLKEQVPVGKGVIDWKEFFATLKTGGVQNIFVEMDPELLEESAKFLKNS
jgi:sugar phosphate isomerase/epimerase